MVTPTDFTKMVPGFDFLQGLMKNAGAGLPSMGQWIAPTLNPEELDKRIEELRTVQFWLDQNAKLLATTIQALEVQRMTLSTLKSMNLPLAELRDALTLPGAAAGNGAASLRAASAPAVAAAPAAARRRKAATAAAAPTARKPPAVAAVDPMQWWGALTQQFTELAAKAVRDSSAEAARSLAGAVVKQGIDSAGQTLKKAVSAPAKVAARVATAAAGASAGTAAAAPAASRRRRA
jgi:hypothetical protein